MSALRRLARDFGGLAYLPNGHVKRQLVSEKDLNNTIVSRRASTILVRLSTNGEHLDCRNNILYTSHAGSSFSILDEGGTASLSHNWMKKGWKTAHSRGIGNVDSEEEIYSENDPGFRDVEKNLFFLSPKSACLNKSGSLPKMIQNNFLLLN